ncbi:molybdotransferase-like divisome protein Glp [Nocardioides ochotonae]|uniref:molybdotransferase-like divisome protein Glp n=1 Tax=Nocardioides ochotonae TaxID=2685869 RepID=UPI001CD34D43|nr:gephyrin-like molybdotransferase Glp [Nocardioides ochotonae]
MSDATNESGNAPAPADRLVSVEEHLDRVLRDLRPLPDHPQPLMDALGLACAEDVVAEVALPSFDNSAMDGYAVVHRDVASASADAPVHLPVVGEIGAGNAQLLALSPGTAAKIMTGAPVPAGADAVVPYEWTDRGVAQVRIDRAPARGQHVRPAGEDVSIGDLVVEHGTVLGPRHLGLLASLGRATVRSRPRPRVVVLSTGSELREPGTPLGHDSIYDGNSFLLAAAARRAGALAYRVGIVPDEPAAFLEALEDQLVRADVVVTSGGVSQGDFDVVKEALAPTGVWFGGVAMQPGKPQGFGFVGEDRTPIFTLPGNPVSSYVSFQLFVLPALRRLMGMEPPVRPTVPARLTRSVASPAGKRQFLRAEYVVESSGASVAPVGGAGSHMIGELASANALIVVPEDATMIAAGERVDVIPLDTER